jgi:hypothetical protein
MVHAEGAEEQRQTVIDFNNYLKASEVILHCCTSNSFIINVTSSVFIRKVHAEDTEEQREIV